MPLNSLEGNGTSKAAKKQSPAPRNRCEINIPEVCLYKLTHNEQQTVTLMHKYVISEVQGVRFIESQNNKIVMFNLVPRKCPGSNKKYSVKPLWLSPRGGLDFVRNSGCP